MRRNKKIFAHVWLIRACAWCARGGSATRTSRVGHTAVLALFFPSRLCVLLCDPTTSQSTYTRTYARPRGQYACTWTRKRPDRPLLYTHKLRIRRDARRRQQQYNDVDNNNYFHFVARSFARISRDVYIIYTHAHRYKGRILLYHACVRHCLLYYISNITTIIIDVRACPTCLLLLLTTP